MLQCKAKSSENGEEFRYEYRYQNIAKETQKGLLKRNLQISLEKKCALTATHEMEKTPEPSNKNIKNEEDEQLITREERTKRFPDKKSADSLENEHAPADSPAVHLGIIWCLHLLRGPWFRTHRTPRISSKLT
ncbi:hypothetical protein V6N12_056763 [Hibiscus sabdariffa]|uniref:Uncharacterized protein n=1 Tax=Hibiscus sabdariffa TaxID=183260 RepID=A0ABR2DDN7_9ROSI